MNSYQSWMLKAKVLGNVARSKAARARVNKNYMTAFTLDCIGSWANYPDATRSLDEQIIRVRHANA